jgi:DNA-binding LytR/AlgR family response regulator
VVLILDGLKLNLKSFLSLKAEYAMKAFDYDATDYLQNLLQSIVLILLLEQLTYTCLKLTQKKKKVNISLLKVI